ncbi:MAG TPA: MOSC domain-containing protein [Capsulimonadaceae bacterium]|nr:MOSC domain-containing protein [Capsulimonadaceae bacterium]
MNRTDTLEIDDASVYFARFSAIKYEAVGYVERIVISVAHDNHRCVELAKIRPGIGVEGDHAWKQWWRGRRIDGREVSAINAEVLDAIDVHYDVPGDNIVVRGLDLSALKAGDTVRVGDLVLKATGASHKPCAVFEQRTSPAKGAAVANAKLRGTMFDALEEGHIRVGDVVERIFLGQQILPLAAENTKE